MEERQENLKHRSTGKPPVQPLRVPDCVLMVSRSSERSLFRRVMQTCMFSKSGLSHWIHTKSQGLNSYFSTRGGGATATHDPGKDLRFRRFRPKQTPRASPENRRLPFQLKPVPAFDSRPHFHLLLYFLVVLAPFRAVGGSSFSFTRSACCTTSCDLSIT